MNHNPHNFKEGDTVRLDKGRVNSSLVQIVRLTKPSAMFAWVKSIPRDPKTDPDTYVGDEWDVMTNRLTPKDGK